MAGEVNTNRFNPDKRISPAISSSQTQPRKRIVSTRFVCAVVVALAVLVAVFGLRQGAYYTGNAQASSGVQATQAEAGQVQANQAETGQPQSGQAQASQSQPGEPFAPFAKAGNTAAKHLANTALRAVLPYTHAQAKEKQQDAKQKDNQAHIDNQASHDASSEAAPVEEVAPAPAPEPEQQTAQQQEYVEDPAYWDYVEYDQQPQSYDYDQSFDYAPAPVQDAQTIPDSASAPGSSTASTPSQNPAPAASSQTIVVRVLVTSDAVGGMVNLDTQVEIPVGGSAYDALVATGIPVNARNTQYGVYVAGINGLVEKQHGGASGWLYAVNGATPGFSAASFMLSAGDTVEWFYTT